MSKKHYAANILIVEDNKVDSLVLESILKSFGAEVDVAQGLDVSDMLVNRYDLVFLDMHMPGIDGFDIANSIGQRRATMQTKAVILVSGDEYDDQLKRKCLEKGIDGYIQKPVNEKILGKILKEFLSNKKVGILKQDGKEKGFFRRDK